MFFLFPRLEHPAGWICARYKSLLLLLLLLLLKIHDTFIRGYWNQTKFTMHKVWWIIEASQIGQTFILLYVKKSFIKTQHGRFKIDPAILAAIGHRFI